MLRRRVILTPIDVDIRVFHYGASPCAPFTPYETDAAPKLGTPHSGPQSSRPSWLVVISAVLPSMMLAEQYLSWLSAMARSTAAGASPLPVTVKCKWVRVNTFGAGAGKPLAGDREMHVDPGEHLGICCGALRGQLHAAAAHIMAAALQDQHHVISGAAPGACQHGLHRAWRQILSAMGRMGGIRCSVHRQDMAAAGFGDKAHAGPGSGPACPAHCAFHCCPLMDCGFFACFCTNLPGEIRLCCNAARFALDFAACAARSDDEPKQMAAGTGPCHAPIVSSISSKDGLSPGPQGPGLFFLFEAPS